MARSDDMEVEAMKSDNKQRYTATPVPSDDPHERLAVKDKENLHLLARFFQAMLLNFLKEPAKVRAIERLNLMVLFDPTGHPDSALTLTFASGRVILECGIKPNPDIKITCEPAVMMKLSRLPAGLAIIKFLMTPEGRDIVARMLLGDLKIQGIVRHPFGMMKFAKFLAPNTN